jgi:hypothetical protein
MNADGQVVRVLDRTCPSDIYALVHPDTKTPFLGPEAVIMRYGRILVIMSRMTKSVSYLLLQISFGSAISKMQ